MHEILSKGIWRTALARGVQPEPLTPPIGGTTALVL